MKTSAILFAVSVAGAAVYAGAPAVDIHDAAARSDAPAVTAPGRDAAEQRAAAGDLKKARARAAELDKQVEELQERVARLELDLKKAGALLDERALAIRAYEVRMELAGAESASLKAKVRAAAGLEEALRVQKRLNEASEAELKALRDTNRQLERALDAGRREAGRR